MMPRGDGTGPAGGGRGFGRGRGMGRGRTRGQGRCARQGLQAGIRVQPAKPTGTLAPTSGNTTTLIAVVDEEACTPCGACQAVCPTEAITLGEAAVKVNAEVCCGCGACAEMCPNDAIKLSQAHGCGMNQPGDGNCTTENYTTPTEANANR